MNASMLPDPSACGTCCMLSASGRPIEHDECAARAVLLEAPDQPDYETLLDLSEEQRAALPARFHTPWFDRDGTPNAWLCRVCWGDGWVTRWPCKTAVEHGAEVFTSDAEAERARRKDAAELAAYRALGLGTPEGRVSASCGNPWHPTWLRALDDEGGCPWCALHEVCERLAGTGLALYEEEQDTARLRLAAANARRRAAELRARVAELEAERHATNEALSDAAEALRANRDRIAELEDNPRLRLEVAGRKAYGDRMKAENARLLIELREARKEIRAIQSWVTRNTPFLGSTPGQVFRTFKWLRETGDMYRAWCHDEQVRGRDRLRELIAAERVSDRLRVALKSARRGRARLRARVAELEAERHATNEALSDAAEALRANRDRIAELEAEAGDGHVRTVDEDPLPIALTQAADMTASQWATAIDAAGLRPGPAFAARYVTGEYDAAVHIATSPMLTDEARQELIEELGTAVETTINRVLCTRTVRITQPAPLTQTAAEVLAERSTPWVGDQSGPVCQCRTDRDGDGNGWIRYQGRDREFVVLRCRDHAAPG